MKRIKIDLRTALTDEAIAKARPHHGECYYAAPCIIGACMPPRTRKKRLDNVEGQLTKQFHEHGYIPVTPNVGQLVELGLIEFATPRQLELAAELQAMFDDGTLESFDAKLQEVRSELANA